MSVARNYVVGRDANPFPCSAVLDRAPGYRAERTGRNAIKNIGSQFAYGRINVRNTHRVLKRAGRVKVLKKKISYFVLFFFSSIFTTSSDNVYSVHQQVYTVHSVWPTRRFEGGKRSTALKHFCAVLFPWNFTPVLLDDV